MVGTCILRLRRADKKRTWKLHNRDARSRLCTNTTRRYVGVTLRRIDERRTPHWRAFSLCLYKTGTTIWYLLHSPLLVGSLEIDSSLQVSERVVLNLSYGVSCAIWYMWYIVKMGKWGKYKKRFQNKWLIEPELKSKYQIYIYCFYCFNFNFFCLMLLLYSLRFKFMYAQWEIMVNRIDVQLDIECVDRH